MFPEPKQYFGYLPIRTFFTFFAFRPQVAQVFHPVNQPCDCGAAAQLQFEMVSSSRSKMSASWPLSFVLLHDSLTIRIRDAAHFICLKKLRSRKGLLASHPQLFGMNSELFPKILYGRLSLGIVHTYIDKYSYK